MTLAAGAEPAQATWILLLTLLLGNGGLFYLLISGLINRRKLRAEAEREGAEAGKVDADATEALVRTSLSLLQPYTEGLARFGAEAERLREENARLRLEQVEMQNENERLKREQDHLRRANVLLEQQLRALQGRLDMLTQQVADAESPTEH